MKTVRGRAFPVDVLRYSVRWLVNPARLRSRPALPTVLNLPVTDNCNARCMMCDVWKEPSEGEITPKELRTILADPLFRKLRHVGISGGEPSLRSDLVDLVEAILESAASLESLSITTHGFLPRRWKKMLPSIREACSGLGVRFRLNLSIDGAGEVHDRVRRIPGGFEKAIETARYAREEGVPVQFQCTVLSENVYALDRTLELALEEGAEPLFRQATVVERLYNATSMHDVALDEGQRSFFADFLRSRTLLDATPNPGRRLFYRDLARRLTEGGQRRAPCFFQNEGALLTQHADVYFCSISNQPVGNALQQSAGEAYFSAHGQSIREGLLGSRCHDCVHDQSGAWSPMQLAAETLRESRIGATASFYWEAFRWLARYMRLELRFGWRQIRERVGHPRRVEQTVEGSEVDALLIGNYGGEHVGDAAILGGVVQRLHSRFRLGRVLVASVRPDRTEFWLSGIELPVPVEVVSYSDRDLKTWLGCSSLLVLAGGPLMDLPRTLASHLDLALQAKKVGARFLLEGIGVGPFRREVSRRLARRIVALADDVSLRGTDSSESDLFAGRQPTVGLDPAFDYIASRDHHSQLMPRERDAVDRLDLIRPDRLVVGVNLRPLWQKYSAGGEIDLAGVKERFLAQMSEGIHRVDGLPSLPEIKWVFFSMNSDQYGFTDLRVAHELGRGLRDGIDYSICEYELGADGLIYLLRHMAAAVTMRLHAAVFCIGLGIPVVGIDYSAGVSGKVTGLFKDRGLEQRVIRVDQFEAPWLESGLGGILASSSPKYVDR